ncbi:hypothetical protein KM043_009615 [Ampulex compressa]|nr:hypothetical protein KM043_009615 [Ampulex compressa]
MSCTHRNGQEWSFVSVDFTWISGLATSANPLSSHGASSIRRPCLPNPQRLPKASSAFIVTEAERIAPIGLYDSRSRGASKSRGGVTVFRVIPWKATRIRLRRVRLQGVARLCKMNAVRYTCPFGRFKSPEIAPRPGPFPPRCPVKPDRFARA